MPRPLIAMLFLWGMFSFAPTAWAQQTVHGEETAGKTMPLTVGGNATFRFASNPSTGYIWAFVLKGDDSVKVTERKVKPVDETPMPGKGGFQEFVVAGKKPGKTAVRFDYQRAWESEAVKQVRVEFLVE